MPGKHRSNPASCDFEKDKRPATTEEKSMLVKYVGWGGIPQVFDPISGLRLGKRARPACFTPGRNAARRHIQACRTGGRGLLLRVDRVRNGRLSAGRRVGGGRDAATGAGARRSDRGRRGRPHRRRAPVQRVEGASPGRCREAPGRGRTLPADTGTEDGTACASDSTAATVVPV